MEKHEKHKTDGKTQKIQTFFKKKLVYERKDSLQSK